MRIWPGILLIVCLAIIPVSAQVADNNPDALQRIGVDEHLGDKLPLEIPIVSEAGTEIVLGDCFRGGKPVIMALFYSNCPMLCSLVLTGLQSAVKSVDFKPGVDYRLVSVSIDPHETAANIQAGRERYSSGFPEGSPPDAWAFYTASDSSIARLTRAIGFRYFWDDKQKMFAHPAAIYVLTPDGRISRYLYGVEFKPNDLRMALLEASEGRIGNTVDHIILYCYHYDPKAGGYVFAANRIMRLGGVATLIGLGVMMMMLLRGKGRPAKTTIS